VLRYLLAGALGYALGRLTRRTPVTSTDGPSPDPYDDVLLTDEEAATAHAWQRRRVNRSHGYVPALPTEAAT
jgi:hypothetical protein